MKITAIALTMVALLPLAGCGTASSAAERDAQTGTATVLGEAAAASGGFSLYDIGSQWVDQRGDSLALRDLAGKVRVVALVYTSCHGTCPLIVNEMKRIESAIPRGRGNDVGFVLVSLDPARDTPGRLATWAADNQIDQTHWTLLNGTDPAVREIAATLGVRYQVQPDGEVAHMNIITVLDTAGIVVHQQAALGDEARATSAIVSRLLAGDRTR